MSILKLLLTFISLHGYLTSDLHSLTPDQIFTVGQAHDDVNAHPHNYPDTAWADHNDCALIASLGSAGNFINYVTSTSTYYL
jgi:hypothetical protein